MVKPIGERHKISTYNSAIRHHKQNTKMQRLFEQIIPLTEEDWVTQVYCCNSIVNFYLFYKLSSIVY